MRELFLYTTVTCHNTKEFNFPDLQEKGKKQSKTENTQSIKEFQQLSWFASEELSNFPDTICEIPVTENRC